VLKFLKKQIVVEAEQFLEGEPLPPGVEEDQPFTGQFLHFVRTKQRQRVSVSYGEWIVKEPDGSGYYPVAAGLFEQLFDPYVEPQPLRGFEPNQHRRYSIQLFLNGSPKFARHLLHEFSVTESGDDNLQGISEVLSQIQAARERGPIRCTWSWNNKDYCELLTFNAISLVEQAEYDGAFQFAVYGDRELRPEEIEVHEQQERRLYAELHAKYGKKEPDAQVHS